MATKDVDVMIEGGKATAAPPVGPALSPLGVNIGQVIAKINEKTKSFAGMQVPVTISVNMETKDFDVTVGSPPVSALLKKEANIDKGSGTPHEEKVADLSLDKIIEIAKSKEFPILQSGVNQILGTCVSMGITVDGKDPREVIQEIKEGKHTSQLQA